MAVDQGSMEQQLHLHSVEGWRSRYLDVKALADQVERIRSLRMVDANRDEFEDEYARFMNLLESELEKINIFYCEAESFFAGKVHLLHHRITQMKRCPTSIESLKSLQCDVLICGRQLLNLEDFVFLNYAGAEDVLKCLDRATGRRDRDALLLRVEKGAFYQQSPPEHLCRILESVYSASVELSNAMFKLTPSSVSGVAFLDECVADKEGLWRECRRMAGIQDGHVFGSNGVSGRCATPSRHIAGDIGLVALSKSHGSFALMDNFVGRGGLMGIAVMAAWLSWWWLSRSLRP